MLNSGVPGEKLHYPWCFTENSTNQRVAVSKSPQINKNGILCHHLLTLMSLHTSMSIFLLLNTEDILKNTGSVFHTKEVNDYRLLFGYQNSSEYLTLCSTEESSYRFETKWGWVNYYFWVNYPFKQSEETKEACFCHWIKIKKGNCDFLSHNSDFFFHNCVI